MAAKQATPRPRRRPPPAPTKRRSILWRWRRGLFLVGLLVFAGIAGTGFVLAQIDLPPERFQAQTSFICTAEVLEDCNQDNATARLFGEQDRVDVVLDEVPEVLVQAVLAAEDRDYFDHGGVDPVGIARAAWADIRGGEVRQGGSTITQQYVKTVYLTNERTIVRKIKEAVLAIKLEQELSKEEILERYLNAIYFGRGAYGVGAAAQAYFDEDIGELDLAEAAYLAGLIRAPEAADGLRDPEEASRRRRTVLDAMLEEGYIDEAQHAEADGRPWVEGETISARPQREGLGEVRGREYGTEYFVEYVRLELKAMGFEDQDIYGGGLRIYTSLDHNLQRAAWDAVHDTLTEPEDPEAALVAVDENGFVRAMYGGDRFAENEFNFATSRPGRAPGSAMKPFALAAAVQQGIALQSRFEAPGRLELEIPGPDWTVSNYGGTEQGVLTLLEATRVSSNTAYAQLMLEVGPQAVVDLAHRMGIEGNLNPYPALVLGTEDVTPLEMAGAYGTFANQGRYLEPAVITRIEFPDGRQFPLPPRRQEQVLTPEQDALVVHALRQVVSGGTATGASLGSVQAAGKTGTTQDNRDAWFVGFLPNGITASVWMGYENADRDGDGRPDPRFMDDVHGRSVTGGSFPATIWRRFMSDWVDLIPGDIGRFPGPGRDGSNVLGADISTTTSSLPPCGEGEEPTEEAPCETTTSSSSSTSTSIVDPSTTAPTPTPTTEPPTSAPPPTDPPATVPQPEPGPGPDP
jgi:penicillin-binding protein 1A